MAIVEARKISTWIYDSSRRHTPLQYIDGHTGEPFASTELQSEVEEHKLQDVLIRRILRVNHFMLLARVAQYWLMDSLIKE